MDKNYRIHAGYILLILVGTIIGLTTSRWGDNPKLVDYVNFAATLTSLVLAFLAIVYAFFSNWAISTNLAKMQTAADSVREVSSEVSAAAQELREKIEAIPSKLDQMEGHVVEIRNRMTMGTMETISLTSEIDESEEGSLKDAIDILPGLALISIYIFHASFREKKSFNGREIGKIKPYAFEEYYMIGVLVTLRAFKLLSFKRDGSNVTVTSFSDQLWSGGQSELRTYVIDGNKVSKRSREKEKEKYLQSLDAIDAYFQQADTLRSGSDIDS